MFRSRLNVALILVFGCLGVAQSAPGLPSEGDVIGRLGPAMATQDPARIAAAFRSMGSYGEPAASFVEASIDALGERHLDGGDIDAAIDAFRLNTDTFPGSANAWESLADAVVMSGDPETGLRYYRRALELDPSDASAMRAIEEIVGERRVSRAGDE